MCMTFLSSAPASKCEVHMFSAELALHYILLSFWDGEDILKNKHFLVCHSHTPTHSVALVSTPSDSVTSIVRVLNKLRPHALKKVSGQFIYLQTFICFFQNHVISPCQDFFLAPEKKGGREIAGEVEEKTKMHQPRICQDFFSCSVMYSCLYCVWCCLLHVTFCVYSVDSLSQHCFVSIL